VRQAPPQRANRTCERHQPRPAAVRIADGFPVIANWVRFFIGGHGVRRAVCRFFADRLREELANVFPSTEPLREDERFNGTFGFRIATKGARRFFLTVLAGEGNETFRVNVACGDSDGYPVAPFSDVRASLADFLRHSESEFQLAMLSPADIPWSWDLDRSRAMWHTEMVRLQSCVKPGDAGSADAFARHLREMPKRCTVALATAAATQYAAEIANDLARFGTPALFPST